jgi:predicted metal-dependent hydrolase
MKDNCNDKARIDRWQDADELKWAVRSWAARVGVKVPQIHLRQMSRKWASISTSGRLTLNLELLELPKELGEFVIVHEILHIIAPNHGKSSRALCLPICRIGRRENGGCVVAKKKG